MKVIHVITSLRTGGAERLMVDLLPRLKALGDDVSLAVLDGERTPFFAELEASGIPIHVLATHTSVYHPRLIFALRRILREADVVHTHNTSPQLFAALAKVLFCPFQKRPLLVTTEHNTTNRRRTKAYLRPFDDFMYQRYAAVVTISQQVHANLLQYLPNTKDKLHLIYNGVELQRFASAPAVAPFTHEGKVVITMVAAFRPQKDQATLIRALQHLPASYYVQLVGTGEPFLIAACQQLASKLHLADRVAFLGMRSDIPDLLRASDLVVLSSQYEGLSLSSIEGMASGRPFLASDVQGLHEIVDGYGILFPYGDDKALAAEITHLVSDRTYYDAVVKQCQQRASVFGMENMAAGYHALYQRLLPND